MSVLKIIMSRITQTFIGFPFVRNMTAVELAEDAALYLLTCHLCGTVPSKVFCLPCLHRLCHICYDQSLQKGKLQLLCPIHQMAYYENHVAVAENSIHDVAKIAAFCFNRYEGCGYKGQLSTLENHFVSCDFNKLLCQRCKCVVLRKDNIVHAMSVCRQGVVNDCSKVAQKQMLIEKQGCHSVLTQPPVHVVNTQISAFCSKMSKSNNHSLSYLSDYNMLRNANPFSRAPNEMNFWTGSAADEAESRLELYRRVEALEDRMNRAEFRLHCGGFRWTVQFSIELKQWLIEGNVLWSEEFLSYTQGYNLRLRLEIVCGKTGGYWIAVYCCLQPGPFDSLLEWPFMKSFTLKLINFCDPGKSLLRTVKITNQVVQEHQEYFERRFSFNYVGCGVESFISIDDLESEGSGFLCNQTLTVECFVYSN